MTTTVLRPNGTVSNTAAIVPSGTAHGVTSDDSNSTYVELSPVGVGFEVNLTTGTFAAGEVAKSVTIRARCANNGSVFSRIATTTAQLAGATFAPPTTATTLTVVTGPVSGVATIADELTLLTFSTSGTPRINELYVDFVTVVQPVTVVTAVSPDPYTASTVVPIAWANTLDAAGGAQTRYQVVVKDTATTDVVYNTGRAYGSNTSLDVGPLTNGDYSVEVRVGQTVNGDTHWSEYDIDLFNVTVATSDVSTVVATPDNANGAIGVVVTRDGGSEAWEFIEVERSFDAGASWTPVRTASFVDSTGDADTFTVTDYETPNGQATIYRARATRYGAGLPITGAWVQATSTSWTSSVNWLKSPLAPSLNSLVQITRWPAQSRNARAGVFYPISSAQPVVVSDVLTSPTGSVTFKVTGSTELLALDALLADSGTLILNLVPASLTGPDRNGFQYVNPIQVTETWLTRNYRDASGDREIRLVTLSFATTTRPPDGTAGAV